MHWVTRGRRSGLFSRKLYLKSPKLALVLDKEGQDKRKDSMLPL